MLRILITSSWPKCWTVALVVVASVFGAAATCRAQVGGRLVSQRMAGRHGLERAWFSRVELDTARNHVVRWILDNDQLLIVTSAGVIQAIDANTGRTIWVTAIGNPDYPSLGPDANDEFVALVNGSTLYVLDRQNGRPITERRVGGAPGAGPALTQHYAFVPLVSGRVEAYPIGDQQGPPWFYQSSGHTLVAPLATSHGVVWSTDTGNLYLAESSDPAVRYRVETASEFLAPAAFRDRMVYAISILGELYAVDERNGSRRWKYATGYPTDRAPAVVGDRVFVSSEQPALHCVDAVKGLGLWEAEGVAQFAAESDKYVYAVDPFGTIVVLDRATGDPVGSIATGGRCKALVNQQTDRLYLMSDDGIVQCFHEIGRRDPMYHDSRAAATQPDTSPGKPEPSEGRSTQDEAAKPQPAPPDRGGTADSDRPALDFGDSFGAGSRGDEQPPTGDAGESTDETPFGVDDENPFAF
jgi:outer membrane protein assembly factor BamB